MRARRLTPSRAITLAAVVLWLLAIAGISQVSAAQLSVITGLQAQLFTVSACADDLSATAADPKGKSGNYGEVEISTIPAACNGLPLAYFLFDDNGAVMVDGTGTASTGVMNFAIQGNYDAEDVVSAAVLIDTWPIPTTWSMDAPPPAAPAQRLESHNYRNYFVRHDSNGPVSIEQNVIPVEDSQFRVVSGLADGSGDWVSFESVNNPGHYLRHYGFGLTLDANDGTTQFAEDATFEQVPGLADSSWWSFRSYNYPDRYIRHYNYELRIDEISGWDNVALNDATYQFVEVN